MGEIKELAGKTDWLTFEVKENDVLDPPVIRIRLRTPSSFGTAISTNMAGGSMSDAFFNFVLDAIEDWDLTADGKPLECSPVNKEKYGPALRLLLGTLLKGDNRFLGMVIFDLLAKPETFLKN